MSIYWDEPNHSRPTIIVHSLENNKRPIGYAPWPKAKKTKKKRAKK